ncbi:aminotransferase class IV family protein [Dyadobacter arcticus]|uniref:4-amino-4-deoxychorismate lyase n=1 Tax=Dyadobacter arcticus TaxID=1078754 RepID=A0ABX0UR97_9BACT|nr:aminotransferase class IV family protein [Dyadobacter arcticus]NIJ55347.1 4-amino-4-deoxychorismate lyase [Dyadobacter arcticus]
MSHTLCIETIRVENREFKHLDYHEARLNKTRKELWGFTDYWNLSEMIILPDCIENELHKCRIAYGKEIDNIKWEPYAPRAIRKIRKVYDDTIDYTYKYNDRDELNTLFAQREDADEVLIIKDGMVTDSFYCNVAFFDGAKWFTPSTYLLPGTQRAFLLDSGVVEERDISENEILTYHKIRLFNAMVGWENAATLEVGLIG